MSGLDRRIRSLAPELKVALRPLVARAKFELIPMTSTLERAQALPPASLVTITASPTKGIESTIEIAEVLKSKGHTVIPHLSARMIRDRAHLTELLQRLQAAGIKRIFAVGGDAKDPGEFPDGLSLLRAIDEAGRPLDEIGIPSYPEGHVNVNVEVLLQALKDKQQYADYMATQLCFDPTTIAAWVMHMRTEGITLEMHLGTPGVTDIRRLLAIAAKIGLADSARYLRKQRSLALRLLMGGDYGPDSLLAGMAPSLLDQAADIQALHIFTFNQVAETVAWQADMIAALA
jgi:methylenetetrahydrofolate reductase (NADPH)